MGGVEKSSYFLPLCVDIAKTVRDKSKVTIDDKQEVAYALKIGRRDR